MSAEIDQLQLGLFNKPFEPHVAPVVSVKSDGSPKERFERFHEQNPHIYRLIVSIAEDLKARGLKRLGMKLIFERIRWLYSVQTAGEDFKLNNNYTAYYSRKIMEEYPEFEGLFEVRGSPRGSAAA